MTNKSPDIAQIVIAMNVYKNISTLPVNINIGMIAADVPIAETNDKIKTKAERAFIMLVSLFMTK